MAVITEGNRPSEAILSEANGTLSREEGVILTGVGIVKAGTVVGKVTANGSYAPYNNTLTNGTETAVGITLYEVDATSADKKVTLLLRDCELIKDMLTWHSANNNAAITAGIADLKAANIHVR